MLYIILEKDNVDELSFAVQQQINEGWEPVGGVSVSSRSATKVSNSHGGYSYEERTMTYVQAMKLVES